MCMCVFVASLSVCNYTTRIRSVVICVYLFWFVLILEVQFLKQQHYRLSRRSLFLPSIPTTTARSSLAVLSLMTNPRPLKSVPTQSTSSSWAATAPSPPMVRWGTAAVRSAAGPTGISRGSVPPCVGPWSRCRHGTGTACPTGWVSVCPF